MLFRTTMITTSQPANEQGFTLVELLVAMTLGLLIALVVTQAYVSSTSVQRAQSDMVRLQESARFAFDMLSHGLRKAGYKNAMAPGTGFCDPSPPARLLGRNDATGLNPASTDLSGTTVTILNSSDIVRIRYYGEGLAISPFTADGSILDCLGNAVAANVLVEDTFFVAADTTNNNEPTLFCYTSNATASGSVPIIPGIESLQVLYGEDTTGVGTITKYVPAGLVSNMNNIRSLMLSVVVRTPSQVAADRSTTRVFNHFGTSYAPSNAAPAGDLGSVFSPATDGRIRQQSSTTVALRNVCPT